MRTPDGQVKLQTWSYQTLCLAFLETYNVAVKTNCFMPRATTRYAWCTSTNRHRCGSRYNMRSRRKTCGLNLKLVNLPRELSHYVRNMGFSVGTFGPQSNRWGRRISSTDSLYALLQKVDPVQQFFSELSDNSAQTYWMPRIGTDSKGNREVKRVELKQRTVQLVLPPANVQRSFRQVLTSDTMPNTRHWQCNDHASDFIDWIGTPPTPSRQSRFVSQNVGPVGIRNSIPTVQRILSSHNPEVVLLQDCQVKNSAREQVHARLWKEWPWYIRSLFDVGLGCVVNQILIAARKTSASTLITTQLSQWCISLLEVR